MRMDQSSTQPPILLFPNTALFFFVFFPPFSNTLSLTIQQLNLLFEWDNNAAKRKIIKVGVTPHCSSTDAGQSHKTADVH